MTPHPPTADAALDALRALRDDLFDLRYDNTIRDEDEAANAYEVSADRLTPIIASMEAITRAPDTLREKWASLALGWLMQAEAHALVGNSQLSDHFRKCADELETIMQGEN